MHLSDYLLSSFSKTDTSAFCTEEFASMCQRCSRDGDCRALKALSSSALRGPQSSPYMACQQAAFLPPHTQLLIHLLTRRFMFSCYFYTPQSSQLCAGVHDAHYHDLTSFPIYVHTWLDHESTQAKSHGMLFWASGVHSKLSSSGTFC